MAFRWLPNIVDFFLSLARLIEDSERQLNSASYDSLEFLVRRLDEYERTLATLTSRFCETYGCVPAQQNTVADLSYLCNRVAFLRSHFQRSLDCDDNSVVISTPGNIRPLQIEHCNRPGRHTPHQKLIQVTPPPPPPGVGAVFQVRDLGGRLFCNIASNEKQVATVAVTVPVA